jgi:hypothetical protein
MGLQLLECIYCTRVIGLLIFRKTYCLFIQDQVGFAVVGGYKLFQNRQRFGKSLGYTQNTINGKRNGVIWCIVNHKRYKI